MKNVIVGILRTKSRIIHQEKYICFIINNNIHGIKVLKKQLTWFWGQNHFAWPQTFKHFPTSDFFLVQHIGYVTSEDLLYLSEIFFNINCTFENEIAVSIIRSRVELPYNIRCLIRKKGYSGLALVNTGTLFLMRSLIWILLQITDESRNYVNV